MNYADVAVDAPVGHDRTFSYSIPGHFVVEPGQLVWVPFGRRVLQGIVVQLSGTPAVEVTRPILQPVEPSPLLDQGALKLGRWLSRYYLSSLYESLSLLLPPGFKAAVRSRIYPAQLSKEPPDSLRQQVRDALASLNEQGHLEESEFSALLGRNGQREVTRLVEQGLITRQVDLPRPRSFRYQSYLVPAVPDQNGKAVATITDQLPRRQKGLLQAVLAGGERYSTTLANKEFGAGAAAALVSKGLLGLEWLRVETPWPGSIDTEYEPPPRLTPHQETALAPIVQALEDRDISPRSFLLHGVTGSGKTEVYLQAIQKVVEQGRQAIFLVPEIALTPQTIHRVNARFPGRVAVLHSRLKPREQFDQWWKIRAGECDVVVGPRSALFAPVPRLGLIIIDEEHEWTYKQEDAQPLYHARTVALEMARLTGAVVVLGSATPSVETYYQARQGRHRLLELPHRIRPHTIPGPPELAAVEVADMREELQRGNRSIFSRRLQQALEECLSRDQQAILFLNRRGSAPFVQCRDCGYVAACSRCSVTLTYHAAVNRLVCHRCNRRVRPLRTCRQCGGSRIRQLGTGTQRVVEEVSALFPGVRVERWDADTTRAGVSAEETMARLASGEIQVLVGTQMVAKGLDVPNVTLVGVVLADIGLYLPDFRAGERAFGLLCQVSGRAGRGFAPGRVIIQTYNPDHYAVTAAAQQDYPAMYRQEIEARRQQGNPPFNRLVHLLFQDVNSSACQQKASATARSLRQKVYAQGLTDVEVIGPAPGIPQRVRGHHRWHLVLRGRQLHRFLEGVKLPQGSTVDVDPAHVL